MAEAGQRLHDLREAMHGLGGIALGLHVDQKRVEMGGGEGRYLGHAGFRASPHEPEGLFLVPLHGPVAEVFGPAGREGLLRQVVHGAGRDGDGAMCGSDHLLLLRVTETEGEDLSGPGRMEDLSG